VKKVVPASAQPGAASLFDKTTNGIERVLGWKEELTPPLRIRLHIGPFLDPRLYRFAGDQNVAAFRELAGLRSDDAFVDIGCGCGRVARALTGYFDGEGTYEGFDAAKKPVDWAKNAITKRYPNFHFQTVDSFNKRYNPTGGTEASELTFPYVDDRFDFAFAGSVYTHMLPDEVVDYVRETRRVLKRGGKTFATYCLLNEGTIPVVDSGKSMPRLPYKYEDRRVRSLQDPGSFIAHPEAWVRGVYAEAGLRILEPIIRGTWANTDPKALELEKYRLGGSPSRKASQDVVLAVKE